ncbi:MAG: CaiB/BaiF CoA transferase family protein [Dehalococcoidia bacterium]
MAEQPFSGLRVIEFGQFVAVPYCAQLLADGGAYVIKVEPHEGDPTRTLAPTFPRESRHFISRNRGKHSLPLDLRHELTPRILDRLLSGADVALFNLRPGLAAEMGLDFATLSTRYPRLICGNVTAFGREGPDRMLAGMDYVVQARSGLMAAMGKVSNGLPTAGDSPIVDFMAATQLAFGVASALYERERTGRGGEVDVSLLGASMTLQNTLFTRVHSVDAAPDQELREWLGRARAEGVPFADQLQRSAGVRPSYMTTVYYRTFATADAAIAVAASGPGLQKRLMAATGLADEMLGRTAGIDREAIALHYAGLQHRIETRFAEKSTAEWKEMLDGAGVPASPVRLPVELLTDEQVRANGLLVEQDHWGLGPVTNLGPPVKLNGDGFRAGPPAAPFGSEARELLRLAGLSEGEIDEAVASGAVREADA